MRKFKISFILLMVMPILWSGNLLAQSRTISGTVISAEGGRGLEGVNVSNSATKKTTQTNSSGVFTILADEGQKLVFTSVGFATRTVTIGSDARVNVTMTPIVDEMENVVVTGYGVKQNRRVLTAQTPTVKGEEIAATHRDNFINSLAGRVPGLTVTASTGLPGASAQIILRGATSIGGNNQPLFVVDGVPLDNNTLNQESLIGASNANAVVFGNRNSDYTNRIADINPNDIEEITILKGPEAAALYGSDGASGAIIITTKKGKAGKARISYDNNFSMQEVYRYPQIQTQFQRGTNGIYNPEAYSTLYGFKYFGPEYPANTPIYNNIKNFFQRSFSQQHNLSIDAGEGNTTYRLSLGYADYNGIVMNTANKKVNARLSSSTKLNSRTTLSTSFAYIGQKVDKAPKGAGTYFNNLITFPIDVDASKYQNDDGSRTRQKLSGDLASEFDNPFWDVNKNKGYDGTERFTANLLLSSDVRKWLNLTTIVGLDQYNMDGFYLTHPQSRFGFATKGFLSTYEQGYKNVNGTFRGTLKKTFATKFANTLSGTFFIESSDRKTNSQRGEQFFEPDFISINNTAPLTRDAKLQRDNIRKVRAFANYTFGYDNLLFISLAGVREGVSTLTSRLYNKQPFFNYGSASGAFVFSDLAAVKNLKWLSYGKLRASLATTGKGPISPYRIDPQFTTVTTTGGGFALDVFASNRNLQPEKSTSKEVGGEFQFFKKKLSVDVAFYQVNSKNQIVANRLSYGTGGVLKYINGGEVRNKGLDIQVKFNPVTSKNFVWDATVNFDKNRSKVLSMPADLPLYYDSDTWVFGAVRSEYSKGVSLGNLVGYDFQRNNAGALLISPTTGLPLLTTNYVNLGDRTPDFKIGIVNSFTFFQNLTFSFNLDIRKGGVVFNGNEAMMVQTGMSLKTLDRLQPRVVNGVLADGLQNTATPTANTISIVPYYRNDYYDVAFAEGDFMEEVNWMRLRDATISYILPDRLMKRQKVIRSASIFVTGTDLFLITNYSGMDPNVNALNASTARGVGGAGIDYGAVPTPRGLNFGTRIQF